jgi:hypothetical protein
MQQLGCANPMIPSLSFRITGRPVKELMQRPQTAQGTGVRFKSLLRTICPGVANGFVIVKSPYAKPIKGRSVNFSHSPAAVITPPVYTDSRHACNFLGTDGHGKSYILLPHAQACNGFMSANRAVSMAGHVVLERRVDIAIAARAAPAEPAPARSQAQHQFAKSVENRTPPSKRGDSSRC